MGNSEVGHLNIGAGRIVYQDLLRIDRAVTDGSLATEATLQEPKPKGGGAIGNDPRAKN